MLSLGSKLLCLREAVPAFADTSGFCCSLETARSLLVTKQVSATRKLWRSLPLSEILATFLPQFFPTILQTDCFGPFTRAQFPCEKIARRRLPATYRLTYHFELLCGLPACSINKFEFFVRLTVLQESHLSSETNPRISKGTRQRSKYSSPYLQDLGRQSAFPPSITSMGREAVALPHLGERRFF